MHKHLTKLNYPEPVSFGVHPECKKAFSPDLSQSWYEPFQWHVSRPAGLSSIPDLPQYRENLWDKQYDAI